MGIIADRIRQLGKQSVTPNEDGAIVGQVDEREQAIVDRHVSAVPPYRGAFTTNILKKAAQGRAELEIEARKQQRAYAEQAPPEIVEPVKEILSSLGDRGKVLGILRQMTPEQRDEALRLAPGVAQQLGDDRGGAVARLGSAIGRGISHGVSQPAMELAGSLTGTDWGGTPEEIAYIRQLDAAASQEISSARPGDPWYERGPLQAAEMAPWMATTVGAGGLGRAAATGVAGRVASSAAAGSKAAGMAQRAGQAVGKVVTAGKAGELTGITAAGFPPLYAQEVDQLKALGMEDNLTLRLLAGGTATVAGLIEGIVPNPFGAGKVPLTEGAAKAARQYLWNAVKRAPGELSEEYLQGVTSGLGQHIAQYLDENAEDKSIPEAFALGWEQTKEAALPMAFLMGVPAVGGASLAAARAERIPPPTMVQGGAPQTVNVDGKDYVDLGPVPGQSQPQGVTPPVELDANGRPLIDMGPVPGGQTTDVLSEAAPQEQSQRLTRLQEIRAKGFVSVEDANEVGIEGNNRKERLANLDKAIEQETSVVQPNVTPETPVVTPKRKGPKDASQVPTNETRNDVQGNGREGSQVDSGGQVRIEGQDQGSTKPTSQEPATQEVQVSDDEYRSVLDQLTTIQTKDDLKQRVPLLKAIYPEYADTETGDDDDPWGIRRAIFRQDEVPRIPTVELNRRIREAKTRGELPAAQDPFTPATDVAEPPVTPAPQQTEATTENLSDQEATARDYAQNFNEVTGDPKGARSRNLHRAIGYARQTQASFDRKLSRGEITQQQRDDMVNSLDGEIHMMTTILKDRGDYSGGGPYSDESGFDSAGIAIPKEKPKPRAAPKILDKQAPPTETGTGARRMDPTEEGRPADGKPIMPGDRFLTNTGRETTPYPKYDSSTERKATVSEKKSQQWLMENAIAEAESRGDDFNLRTFRNELEDAKKGKLPQASKDSATLYVFGDYIPKVPKPILKDVLKPTSKWQAETRAKLDAVPALKGSKVDFDEDAGTVNVTRPDGLTSTIHFNADEELADIALKKGRKPEAIFGYARSRSKTHSDIYVRSDADHTNILNHEVMHWLEFSGVVTKEEVEKYGGREKIAEDYAAWASKKQRSKNNNLFNRIYEALEAVFSSRQRFFEEVGKRGVEQKKPAAPKILDKSPAKKGVIASSPQEIAEVKKAIDQQIGGEMQWESEENFGVDVIPLNPGEDYDERMFPADARVYGARFGRLDSESDWGVTYAFTTPDGIELLEADISVLGITSDKNETQYPEWVLRLPGVAPSQQRLPSPEAGSPTTTSEPTDADIDAMMDGIIGDMEGKPAPGEGSISVDEFAAIFANPEPTAPPRKPKSIRKDAPSKPKSIGKKKTPNEGVQEGLNEAKEGANLIRKGLKDLGSNFFSGPPINADIARGMGMMANGLIKAGKYKFAEFIDAAVEMIGAKAVRYLGPYLEAGWNEKAKSDSRLDKATSVTKYLSEDQGKSVDYGTVDSPNVVALGEYFADRFRDGAAFPRITDARKEAGSLLGGMPKDGTQAIKVVDEAIELGVVMAARDIAQSGDTDAVIYDQLVDLYSRQPNLGTRTSTSMLNQAYSTPAPLAFLVNRQAGISQADTVYDSSAGNGMLLIVGGNRIANELNPERAAALRAQGIETTSQDATEFELGKPITALAINPPFGEQTDEGGSSKQWSIDGVKTDKVDHAITLRSLAEIPDDGKVAIIIGAKGFEQRKEKDNSRRGRAYLNGKGFYDAIYNNYNVVDHYTVHGDLYSRQGAAFPVDVIIIEGRGVSSRPKPYNINSGGIPQVFESWQELKDAKLLGDKRKPDGADSKKPADTRKTGVPEKAGETTEQRPAGPGEVSTGVKQPSGRNGRRPGDNQDVGRPNGTSTVPEQTRGDVGTRQQDKDKDGRDKRPKDSGDGGVASKTAGGTKDTDDRRNRLNEEAEVKGDQHQSSYTPGSGAKGVDALIPNNHQTAVQAALDAVVERYGSIDDFVASELGIDEETLYKAFSAEQVDALALGMARHKEGKAFILGDQTGVGKGRVAAGMMVYAKRQGFSPVFMTEKPTLYADMIRDMIDIGFSTDEKPFNPLMTNSTSKKEDQVTLPDGRILKQTANSAKANIVEAIDNFLNGKGLVATTRKGTKNRPAETQEYDAVFTTYDQMATIDGQLQARHEALKKLSPKAFFILDESHNAGGSEQNTKKAADDHRIPVSQMVRDLIASETSGVYFSSATYAKRPSVMDLYSKTGMTAATSEDGESLADSIAAGGVPLQQIVSQQLVESGAYLRRERSFDGVEFKPQVYDVSTEGAEQSAAIFRAINAFDKVKQALLEAELSDDVTSEGGLIRPDWATGEAGMTSTNFSSILWNLTDQMLLAVKADSIADEAISSLKRGESPVIYVDATMEAALDAYIESSGLQVGEQSDFSFRDLLQRYLERSREVLVQRDVTDPDSYEQVRLTDEQLGERGLAAFNAAQDLIDNFDAELPASPIDWIRKRIEDAGYSFGEYTGRHHVMRYDSTGKATLEKRPEDEQGASNRIGMIRKYNAGELDVLLFNASGATGVSMHASEKFKNQKPRHMIIGQPSKNIDTFMQSLGRVHRTGQVTLPKFSLAMTSLPSEIRPASVLVKKLASLNANVTASDKGSVSFDIPDVMNTIGDRIVAEYLAENQDLNLALNEGQDEGLVATSRAGRALITPGIARKASGRMAIMPIKTQQEFWDHVTETFTDLIEELDRMGANPLSAKVSELDAKTVEAFEIFDGDPDADNAFERPAYIEKVIAKRPGKPMTPDEIRKKVNGFYDLSESASERELGQAARNWQRSTLQEVSDAVGKRIESIREEGESKGDDQAKIAERVSRELAVENSFKEILNSFVPGISVSIWEGGATEQLDIIPGVVLSVVRKGKGGHPASLSRWRVEIAMGSPDRIMRLSLSQLQSAMESDMATQDSGLTTAQRTALEQAEGFRVFSNRKLINDESLKDFQESEVSTVETRYIGTGNILAAFNIFREHKGRVTFFRDSDGNLRRGVILPRSFNVRKWENERPVVFDKVSDIREFLSSGNSLVTPDRSLNVMMLRGDMVFRAPKSRSGGGKYTLNQKILRAASPNEFVSIGSRMEMVLSDPSQQDVVLKQLLSIASLQAVVNKDEARSIKDRSSDRKSEQTKAKANEKLKQANQAMRDAINETKGKPTSGLDPIVAAKVAKAAKLYIEAGILDFKSFVEKLIEDFSAVWVRDHARYLESVWRIANKRGWVDSSAGKVADLLPETPEPTKSESAKSESEPVEPEKPKPEPQSAPKEETTGTKYARTEGQRTSVGDAAREQHGPRNVEERQQRAIADLAAHPERVYEIIEDMNKKPRPLTDDEDALLGARIRELKNDGDIQGDDRQEWLDINRTVQRGHSEWGYAGHAAQVELASDFSIEGLTRRHARDVGSDPTPEQMAKYQEMADKIAALEGEVDALKKKVAQDEVDRAIAEAKAKADAAKNPPPPKKGTKKEVLQKKASEAVDKFKSAWAKLSMLGAVNDPRQQADKWVEVTKAAGEVIKAYAELGVNSFLELMASVKQDIGDLEEYQAEAFKEAWGTHKKGTKAESPLGDRPDSAGIGRLARDLTRWAVESGIEDREEVIDAVHQELQDMEIELTRSEVMAAMSGYGDFRELPKDDVSVKVRGIKGEIQQLLKLEDMQAGKAPLKTGVERREPTEDERKLIKDVNEAKKRGGYEVTDPERQLTTPLRTAKKAVSNRIKDLESEIKELEDILRSEHPTPRKTAERTPPPTDAELEALRVRAADKRKQRDELKKEYEKIFPPKKNGMTDANRLKAAEALLTRQIRELQADIDAGRLDAKEKRAPLVSDVLTAKREELARLKEVRDQARLASPEYQAKLEAKITAQYKRNLEKQLAFWEARRDDAAQGKLPEKRKSKTPVDNEILEKKWKIEQVKRQATAEIENAERAARGPMGKALGFGGDLLDLARAIQTGYEMSATLRQGAMYTLGFPQKALSALVMAFEAALSRRADFAHHDNLLKRKRHLQYIAGKMETTAADGPLSKREESIRSRLASWLSQQEGWLWAAPRWIIGEGVLASERAFRTFSNTMRADLFDIMADVVDANRPGTWSDDDAKIIGHAANVISGRAPMRHSVAWGRVLFAPRWVWSRALLTVGEPMWKGDKATRLAVGKVYVRAAIGMGILQGMKHVMYGLLADDDDDKPKYEWDPRSSDFGKMRIGDTRIDTGAGVNQLVTLVSRLATGQTKRMSGEIVDLTGDEVPYGASDATDVITRFLRTKLAPLPSGVIDWIAKENVIGEKVTAGKIVGDRLTPMTWADIWDAEKALNVPQGTVAGIEAFFGSGVSTYGDKTKYRESTDDERAELFEKTLERLEWNDPAPAYAKSLSPVQRDKVETMKQYRFGQKLDAATGDPKSKDGIKSKDAAIEALKQSGVTYEQARQMMIDHWKSPLQDTVFREAYVTGEANRLEDFKGKKRRSHENGVMNSDLQKRIRRLKAIYGVK